MENFLQNIDVRKSVIYDNARRSIMDEIINITNLRKDLYKISESVINDGLIVTISSKSGNLVMISKKEYDSLLETLYLLESPEYAKSLIDGKNASDKEVIKEEDVKW